MSLDTLVTQLVDVSPDTLVAQQIDVSPDKLVTQQVDGSLATLEKQLVDVSPDTIVTPKADELPDTLVIQFYEPPMSMAPIGQHVTCVTGGPVGGTHRPPRVISYAGWRTPLHVKGQTSHWDIARIG